MDDDIFPQPPMPLPPKQKPKPTNQQANQAGDAAPSDSEESGLSDEEIVLGSLFSEDDMPRDSSLPALVSLHLPGLAAADYIDPFTVPAGHMLEQGIKIDIASMLEAGRLGEQQGAVDDTNTDIAPPTSNADNDYT